LAQPCRWGRARLLGPGRTAAITVLDHAIELRLAPIAAVAGCLFCTATPAWGVDAVRGRQRPHLVFHRIATEAFQESHSPATAAVGLGFGVGLVGHSLAG
jgi:hypothetical protein